MVGEGSGGCRLVVAVAGMVTLKEGNVVGQVWIVGVLPLGADTGLFWGW